MMETEQSNDEKVHMTTLNAYSRHYAENKNYVQQWTVKNKRQDELLFLLRTMRLRSVQKTGLA